MSSYLQLKDETTITTTTITQQFTTPVQNNNKKTQILMGQNIKFNRKNFKRMFSNVFRKLYAEGEQKELRGFQVNY